MNHSPDYNIGILAHVDAGKTTLSEAILYEAGAIRRRGRVDHGSSCLDTDVQEKERGITIFSKQVRFSLGDKHITLVDTPGHADFSPEMERTLRVLDYAILVVSAADGVDARLPVLWRLLSHYHVPTFFFINKMDRPDADRGRILASLRAEFGNALCALPSPAESVSSMTVGIPEAGDGCPAVRGERLPVFSSSLAEEIAVLDDTLLAEVLESGHTPSWDDVRRLIRGRKLCPVAFGSALKDEGIREFLSLLSVCLLPSSYPETFGAHIFKISREGNLRLSWMKITGGTLRPRDLIGKEKVDQILLVSGGKSEAVPEALAGTICAVSGLRSTRAGQGLGAEPDAKAALLQPILSCELLLPDGTDPFPAYEKLRLLEEEEPQLQLRWDPGRKKISARISGQIQTEILRRTAADRFGLPLSLGPASVLYRETISAPILGSGHFEPLRHYAEVHLLLEPGAPGSGVVVESRCPADVLSRSWQKQILSALQETLPVGVLTGAELTDLKIILVAGRAHPKHTDGGDFREAACRAVRHGLMHAGNLLLEPVLTLRLELPPGCVGRAMHDIEMRDGTAEITATTESSVTLEGCIAAAALGNYAQELAAYSGGQGRLLTDFAGYEPCRNADEVIAASAYLPEEDTAHPASSVFCFHGAGTIVPWDQASEFMHMDTAKCREALAGESAEEKSVAELSASSLPTENDSCRGESRQARRKNVPPARSFAEEEAARRAFDDELQDIFERTYGRIQERIGTEAREYNAKQLQKEQEEKRQAELRQKIDAGEIRVKTPSPRTKPSGKEYLLIDGYNIIWAWEELRRLAETNIKAARDRLTDILVNFSGFRREHLILVFDAYRVPRGTSETYHLPGLDIIYTKQAETADLYIEKAARELCRKSDRVTVASSDAVEQIIIMGSGALRLSAAGLLEEITRTQEEMRGRYFS